MRLNPNWKLWLTSIILYGDIKAADLFCGSGGTSTGLLKAAKELGLFIYLMAINHWDLAIATHQLNHPGVDHKNSDLETIDPLEVIPGGWLDLLVASPECTYYSNAAGGRPVNVQSRATPKWILKWKSRLKIHTILMENVAEFRTWGPLHRKGEMKGRPIQNRKGEYYHRFLSKLEEGGYTVKARVLNCADYGDATTRKRLFIIASLDPDIPWPEPTHSKTGGDMFGTLPKWRAAKEIIDFGLKGKSIFNRKTPLASNTMRRIMVGLEKCSGLPFLLGQQSGATPRPSTEPVPTVAAAGAISLIQPYLVPFYSENGEQTPRTHPITEPVPTIPTVNRFGFVEPFLIKMEHGGHSDESHLHDLKDPMPTITSADAMGLAEPFIVPVNHGVGDVRTHDINSPMPTITTFDALGMAEPFIVALEHTSANGKQVRPVGEPLQSVTGEGRFGIVEPTFMVRLNGTTEDALDNSSIPVDQPVPTITGQKHIGLVQAETKPFLVEYHGTSEASGIDEPVPTITSRDRFALTQPMVFKASDGTYYVLDILFRMLTPAELARAMSFPEDYQFRGNREQIVKQIGNAVPCRTAEALCSAILKRRREQKKRWFVKLYDRAKFWWDNRNAEVLEPDGFGGSIGE